MAFTSVSPSLPPSIFFSLVTHNGSAGHHSHGFRTTELPTVKGALEIRVKVELLCKLPPQCYISAPLSFRLFNFSLSPNHITVRRHIVLLLHRSMHTSNMYAVLEDGIAALDVSAAPLTPPNSADQREEEVYKASFDLVQLGSELRKPRIFTCELLQQIKNNKLVIITNLRKPQRQHELSGFDHLTSAGTYKVFRHDESDTPSDNYDCVSVRFMSRVELHPDFQRRFWRSSRTNCQLRVINGLQGKPDWIPVPYSLTLDEAAYSSEHLNTKVMQGYWDALQKTKRLWLEGASRSKILRTTANLAVKHNSITKIVCLGLGALNHDKAFYESGL